MPAARPILFSAPMIRALIDSRKTQTRRIMKPQPQKNFDGWDWGWLVPGKNVTPGTAITWRDDHDPSPAFRHWYCPYGRAGDLLWVREAFIHGHPYDGSHFGKEKIWYRADNDLDEWQGEDGEMTEHIPWKPSIHMPRAFSRLTLEITNVRTQRLQDITPEDAIAEGLRIFDYKGLPAYAWKEDGNGHGSPKGAFWALWDHVNGPESWKENPWIWALTFKVHQCNVDALLQQKAA
jgi:hypothetical protein